MVIYYDDNGHILRRQWSYTTKMVKYHENGHIRRKWPYTTNMVIYLKAWCATAGSGSSSSGRQLGRCGSGRYCFTGNGSSHLGVSSGGVEVDGTVFVRASLTENGHIRHMVKMGAIREMGSTTWQSQCICKRPPQNCYRLQWQTHTYACISAAGWKCAGRPRGGGL